MIVSGVLYTRLLRQPTERSSHADIPWRANIFILFAASILIMVRSLFRVVEYVQGNKGYILEHEAFMYAFDSALMLCLVVLFNLRHPSGILSIDTDKKAIGVFFSKTPIASRGTEKSVQRTTESDDSLTV